MGRMLVDSAVDLNDEFYCRSKKRRVTLEECLERYVDANAFEQKRSVCWRCYQGRKLRADYALGAG